MCSSEALCTGRCEHLHSGCTHTHTGLWVKGPPSACTCHSVWGKLELEENEDSGQLRSEAEEGTGQRVQNPWVLVGLSQEPRELWEVAPAVVGVGTCNTFVVSGGNWERTEESRCN